MSSVIWDGDNLIQKVGQDVEQLGHVKLDENAGAYVLWLNDTRGVFGPGNTYIRGDTFPSMKDAKQRAASSVSASLFHHMWLVGLRDSQEQSDSAIAQAIADAEDGKPLKESTFKEEMERSRKRGESAFLCGIGCGLGGIGCGLGRNTYVRHLSPHQVEAGEVLQHLARPAGRGPRLRATRTRRVSTARLCSSKPWLWSGDLVCRVPLPRPALRLTQVRRRHPIGKVIAYCHSPLALLAY